MSNQYNSLDELPEGAVVGTSSLRRQCQLLKLRPDLAIRFLRGNVNTRLTKLDNGEYDAIILAAAGLIRLEMADRIRNCLSTEQSLPAAGQGAVGIEIRTDDQYIQKLLAPLHDQDTADRVLAERAMNRRLNGGCQVPVACYSELDGEELFIRGLVGQPDGSVILEARTRCHRNDGEKAGIQIAEKLLEQGAEKILSQLIHE